MLEASSVGSMVGTPTQGTGNMAALEAFLGSPLPPPHELAAGKPYTLNPNP